MIYRKISLNSLSFYYWIEKISESVNISHCHLQTKKENNIALT